MSTEKGVEGNVDMEEDEGGPKEEDIAKLEEQLLARTKRKPLPNRKVIRRFGVTTEVDIDLILCTRVKKENIVLPPVAYKKETIGRGSLRHVKISDKEYDQLRKEVVGSEETGNPARPELEIFTVGVGGQRVADLEIFALEKKLAEEEEERLNKLEDEARIAKGKKPKKRKPKVVEAKKKVIEDEIDGSGIEVMFDNAKMMFILSDRSEDMLIMSLKHNEAATYHIHHSLVRIGADYEFSTVDKNKQRLWRRFLRDYARYQVHNEARLQSIPPRYDRLQKVLAKQAYKLANRDRVWAKEELSSDDSSDDGKKKKKKKRRKKRPGSASELDSSDFDSRPTTAADAEEGEAENADEEGDIENNIVVPGDDSIEGLKAKFGKYLELEPMRSRILLEYAKIDLNEEKALKLQEDIEAGLIQPPSEELPKQPKKASAITYGGQALKIREKKNVPLVRM